MRRAAGTPSFVSGIQLKAADTGCARSMKTMPDKCLLPKVSAAASGDDIRLRLKPDILSPVTSQMTGLVYLSVSGPCRGVGVGV